MQTFFNGVFARGISLIAIVIGGAVLAMDESGGSEKKVGDLVFGSGLTLLAAQFLNWTFGTTLSCRCRSARAAERRSRRCPTR